MLVLGSSTDKRSRSEKWRPWQGGVTSIGRTGMFPWLRLKGNFDECQRLEKRCGHRVVEVCLSRGRVTADNTDGKY